LIVEDLSVAGAMLAETVSVPHSQRNPPIKMTNGFLMVSSPELTVGEAIQVGWFITQERGDVYVKSQMEKTIGYRASERIDRGTPVGLERFVCRQATR
jgi:hypothetical protein